MIVSSFTNPSSFSCNVHVLELEGGAGAIVVDPGYYGAEVRDAVERAGGLAAVLLTHGHWDHVGCTDALLADWPGVPVLIHEADAAFLNDPLLNGSAAMGRVPITVAAPVATFSEGPLEVAGVAFSVLHTPGHTVGSSVLHLPRDNRLFTGDTMMDGGIGRTDLPTGSASDQRASLRKLFNAGFSPDTMCYVGHGRNLTWSGLLQSIGFRR